MKNALPETLHDILNSRGWDYFISDRLGNDLFINDPDRASRIHDAAENGCDGSTHAEHIEDQRDYIESLYRDEMTDENEAEMDSWRDKLMAELDDIEKWHSENGSLYNEVG